VSFTRSSFSHWPFAGAGGGALIVCGWSRAAADKKSSSYSQRQLLLPIKNHRGRRSPCPPTSTAHPPFVPMLSLCPHCRKKLASIDTAESQESRSCLNDHSRRFAVSHSRWCSIRTTNLISLTLTLQLFMFIMWPPSSG
jgi:hypothetical protein